MTSRHRLVLASVILILAMCALVPWLTRTLCPVHGYIAIFCIYWFCFCLPAGWHFQRGAVWSQRFSLKVGAQRWVPWAVTLQVGAVALSSWHMRPESVPLLAVVLAMAMGLVNGFSEEFFWRGAFLEQGRGNIPFQVLGVGLFTAWHVPLAFAHGIIFPGGALALVGGAMCLGAFWSVIAVRTDRIGWPIVSHVLTNCIVFIAFVSLNFL